MAIIKLDTKQTFVDNFGNEVNCGPRYVPTVRKDHDVWHIDIIDFGTGLEYTGGFSYECKGEVALALKEMLKENTVDLGKWSVLEPDEDFYE